MKNIFITSAFFLCLSFQCFAQHQNRSPFSTGETVYPIVDSMRDQIIKTSQKYSNVRLSEEAVVPVFLDGNFIRIDSLNSIPLKNIASITVDYNTDRLLYGSQVKFGVIEIKTRKEEE